MSEPTPTQGETNAGAAPSGLPAIAKVLAQYRSSSGRITEAMIEAAWAEHAAVVEHQKKVRDSLKNPHGGGKYSR